MNTPSTNSTSNWPEKARGSPEWVQKLRDQYGKRGEPKPIKLQAWSKAAIAWQITYGKTNGETAEHFGVGKSRYERHKTSREGKDWQEKIQELYDDPNKVTRMVLQSEGLGLAIDQFALYETAKEKGDVATAHKIAKNLLDYAGLEPQKIGTRGQAPAVNITLTLPGSNIDELMASPLDVVETSYEIIDDTSTNRRQLPAGRRDLEEATSAYT